MEEKKFYCHRRDTATAMEAVYDQYTFKPINRIGKSEKLQYRIGIGSADYWAQYRLIGFGSKKRLI